LPGRWTPTFVEGFGAVLIEAGIRGKPVIGARVGGIPEAVYENKTGFLFEPENVDDLTSACERLLADADLRKTFGNFARSYVKERFSNSVMAENNMHILRQLTRVTPS
ncbi:glycosyltransferase family 4 protein, partial [bacterium]|nr:glycosyltransferase family 4 protein [bacterium]